MNALWDFLIQFATTLWPFRTLEPWEQGVYLWWSRPIERGPLSGVKGPGHWPVLPWLMDVRGAEVVPAIVRTRKQDFTLGDGAAIYYSLSAVVRVVDVRKALFAVDQYKETLEELMEMTSARMLANAKSDRFETKRRVDSFYAELTKQLDEAARERCGVQVISAGFRDFTLGLRTYRLLTGEAAAATISW